MNVRSPRPLWRRSTTRRSLLRGALAFSPAVFLASWKATEALAAAITGTRKQTTGAQLAVPACVVTPQQTEGPYFVDELLNRSDVRSDPTTGTVSDGMPLRLGFSILEAGGSSSCSPISGAVVDLWQCDAMGVYSDVHDNGQGFDTRGQKFLRGFQVTDDNGYVEFLTIYPGWYQGRTVHIHFKVRTHPQAGSGYEFTSQVYFDDALTDQVHALPPYAAKGQRTTRNADDGIYRVGGEQLLLQAQPSEDGASFSAMMAIGVDLSAPPPAVQGGGPPPRSG